MSFFLMQSCPDSSRGSFLCSPLSPGGSCDFLATHPVLPLGALASLWPHYSRCGPPSETPRVLKKAGPRPDSTLGQQSPGQQLPSRSRSRAELEGGGWGVALRQASEPLHLASACGRGFQAGPLVGDFCGPGLGGSAACRLVDDAGILLVMTLQ